MLLLGYGGKGPDADKPAFDSTAFWSKSGFLHDQALCRDDFAPINPPFGVSDTACGYLEKVTFASGNTDIMPTSPIEMKSVCELKTVPAGDVGADTRKVLAEFGYSEKQIEAMLAAGAAK